MIAVVLVLAALADDGWKPVLEEDPYRFCNEPGAQGATARDWCELLKDAPPDRCRGLRATCDGAPAKADVNDLIEQLRGCAEGSGDQRFTAPPEPSEKWTCDWKPEGCDQQTPRAGAAAAILRWVTAIMVALGLLVVLRLLFSWFGTRIDRPIASEPQPARLAQVPLDDIPDLPSDDLLAAARRALREGRTGEAVLLARGAALRRLGEVGRLLLHRARTDREYLRQLRKDPAVEASLREVVSAVEVHRWGGRPVPVSLAEAALAAAERVIAAIAVGLLLVLVPTEARASRYDPYGDAALSELFRQAGYQTSWRLRGLGGLAAVPDETDVLVIDLWEIAVADEDNKVLRGWVEQGGLLVVGGDSTAIFPELGTYADHRIDEPDTDVAPGEGTVVRDANAPLEEALPTPLWPDGPLVGFHGPAATAVPWFHVVFDDSTDDVITVLSIGQGGVIAIADPRLLRNGALVAPANEAFLVEAPYVGTDAHLWTLDIPARLELATRAGEDAENPWSSLANARLLPLTLQLFGLGLLVAWWRGAPFAPLRDPPTEGRLSFADHVRALGTRYARLGASRRALAAYAKLWLARLGPAGLVEAARRSGKDPASALEWVRHLEGVAESPEGPNGPSDLKLLEELWRITRHQ